MTTTNSPADPPTLPAAPMSLLAAAAGDAELGTSSIDAGESEVRGKMGKGYLTVLLIGYGALFLAWTTPTAFSLAVRVQQIDPAGRDSALAIAIGLPGIIVLLTGPLSGVLSDQTKSRFGRRRPWFLLGTLVGFAGSTGVALSDSIPLIIAAWTVAYVGYTTAGGMIITHLSDRLPEEQRGRVAGLSGSMTQLMAIIGIVLAGSLVSFTAAMFLVPAAIGVVGGIAFALIMKDPAPLTAPPRADMKTILHGYWFDPRRHPNLGWVWLSRALVFVALSFYSLYTVYLLSSKLSLDPTAVAGVVAVGGGIGILVSMLGAIAGGYLSDRLRNRKFFLVLGAVLLGAALLLIATTSSVPHYLAGALLASLGIGVYAAVDQATFLDVIPTEEGRNGRYLGIINLANQIPQAVGPFIAGLLIVVTGGDYTWVYVIAGGFAVLGAITILPLRIKLAPRNPAESAVERPVQ